MESQNNNYFSKGFSKRRRFRSKNPRRDKPKLKKELKSLESSGEDSSGEAEVVNPKVYETIAAPLLTKWTREAVRTFMEKRKVYKDQMKQIEGGEKRILPFRLSIGDSIRSTFCDFVIGKEFEEITDKDVEEAFQLFVNVQPKGDLELIHQEAIRRSLQMNYKLLPDERVFRFFEDHRKILQREGLEAFAKNHPKKVIKQLTRLLQPQALSDVVTGILLEKGDEGPIQDYKSFFNVVSEQMMLIAPFFNQK